MTVRIIVSIAAPDWHDAVPGAEDIAEKAARAALRAWNVRAAAEKRAWNVRAATEKSAWNARAATEKSAENVRAASEKRAWNVRADAEEAELGIVLADDQTLRHLNRDFRGHDRATNVLAFDQTAALADALATDQFLGDVFVGLGVAAREAAEQNKRLADHLAHLVVHGVLHLCGDDHAAPDAAAAMESLERRILAGLDVADPYEAMDAASAA